MYMYNSLVLFCNTQNNRPYHDLNSGLTEAWTSGPQTLTISTTQTGPSRLEYQVSRSMTSHPLVPFCNTQNSPNLLNSAWQCLGPPVLRYLAARNSGGIKADLREFKAPRSHYNLLIDVSLVWLDSTQNHYHS